MIQGGSRLTTQPIATVGGPLDGNVYNLHFEAGGTIELNSAAGVCIYRFDDAEPVAHYIGPA